MFPTDGLFCVMMALILLVLPIRWVAGAVLAAAFHELCHYLALRGLGCNVGALHVDRNGAVLEVQMEENWKELLCALAGPAGSFFLVCGYRWVPEVSICALIQGVFNMIPVYPLDGGRVLLCFLRLMFPGSERKSYFFWERILAISTGFVCILLVRILGFLPVGLWILVAGRCIAAKRPCKPGKLRVQ